jgi:alpha-beta hydrolase superfamily lysophospholipase
MKELIVATSRGNVRLLHFPSNSPTDKKLFCLHGYCCDARIFSYLCSRLSEKGIDAYSIDLPGFGKSFGDAGDPDFEGSLAAIHEVIAQIRGQSKVFLLGHSLGSTYAMWYNRKYPNDVDGMIMMALYVRMKGQTNAGEALPAVLQFLRLYIMRKILPRRLVSAERVVRTSVLQSREVQEMLADPEVRYHFSYRFIIDVIGGKNQHPEYLAEMNIPVLVLHGLQDRNVFPEVSNEFFKIIRSERKQIKTFDSDHWFYRAVFFNQNDSGYTEDQRMRVVAAISNWLASQE